MCHLDMDDEGEEGDGPEYGRGQGGEHQRGSLVPLQQLYARRMASFTDGDMNNLRDPRQVRSFVSQAVRGDIHCTQCKTYLQPFNTTMQH